MKSIVNRLRLCPREFYDFLPRGKVTAMRSSLRLREKRPRNIRPEDGERVRRRAGEEGGCEKIAETRLENPDGSRYFRAQKRYDAVPFRVPCALKRPSPGGWNTAQCGKFDVHVKSPRALIASVPIIVSANAEIVCSTALARGAKHAKSGNARKFMRSLETLHRDSQSPFRLYATRLAHAVMLRCGDVKLTCLSVGRTTKVENAQLNGKADNVV